MSLRLKIILLLGLMAAAATAVIGITTYRSTSRELRENIDRSLDSAAQRFQRVPDFDGNGPRPGFDQAPIFEQVLWQVIAADGTVLSSPATGELPVTEADLAVASSDNRRTFTRDEIDLDGESFRTLTIARPGGAVILARSLEENEQIIDRILTNTLVAVLAVTAGVMLLGWLIALQITRRLERLTVAAGAVATTGRLDVDVPVDGTDETGRLGRAFSGMLDALARSRREQQQLVQDAGHELRTPLTSLRTNVSVLQRSYDTLPVVERDRLLADLDSETRELTDLVNELVELATEQRDDEPMQSVALAAVAERAADRARRRFGRDVVVAADGSTVHGRPQALERAVQNLIDNACKFAPNGDIDVTVTDGTVSVRDHGPGIVESDVPHVFDRFYRSVEMRGKPGSGLGLSIVKSIVESHGGTVFARNAEGGGAVVGCHIDTVAPSL